jgi:hypothetical protein
VIVAHFCTPVLYPCAIACSPLGHRMCQSLPCMCTCVHACVMCLDWPCLCLRGSPGSGTWCAASHPLFRARVLSPSTALGSAVHDSMLCACYAGLSAPISVSSDQSACNLALYLCRWYQAIVLVVGTHGLVVLLSTCCTSKYGHGSGPAPWLRSRASVYGVCYPSVGLGHSAAGSTAHFL